MLRSQEKKKKKAMQKEDPVQMLWNKARKKAKVDVLYE